MTPYLASTIREMSGQGIAFSHIAVVRRRRFFSTLNRMMSSKPGTKSAVLGTKARLAQQAMQGPRLVEADVDFRQDVGPGDERVPVRTRIARRIEQQAPRSHQRSDVPQARHRIRQVLEHLHRGHHVEGASMGGQLIGPQYRDAERARPIRNPSFVEPDSVGRTLFAEVAYQAAVAAAEIEPAAPFCLAPQGRDGAQDAAPFVDAHRLLRVVQLEFVIDHRVRTPTLIEIFRIDRLVIRDRVADEGEPAIGTAVEVEVGPREFSRFAADKPGGRAADTAGHFRGGIERRVHHFECRAMATRTKITWQQLPDGHFIPPPCVSFWGFQVNSARTPSSGLHRGPPLP